MVLGKENPPKRRGLKEIIVFFTDSLIGGIMAVFKRYLIRVLALSFGCFLKKYNGLLGIKEKINKLSNGIYKEILIYVFNNKLKKSGSWIGYRSKLGKNLVFPHDITGIFISQGAEIENNCVIFQQVTIGSNTLNDSKGNGSPIIGDNCYIGAGAKIIGGL